MNNLDELLAKNAKWAKKVNAENPTFFNELSKRQTPEYLWIGCSDSRVPESQIMDLLPGDVFVHRNIANRVVHTDLNCISVIHFAVKVLKVKNIIVTGHYGCGGIKAAMQNQRLGILDHWLSDLRSLYLSKVEELEQLSDEKQKFNRMCELNIMKQVSNVAQLPEIQEAWSEGQEISIHGLIYDLATGMLNKITNSISSSDDIDQAYSHLD